MSYSDILSKSEAIPWASGTTKSEEVLCPDKGTLENRTEEWSKECCGLVLSSLRSWLLYLLMSRNWLPTALFSLTILFPASENDVSIQVSRGRARYCELTLELRHSFSVVINKHIFRETPEVESNQGCAQQSPDLLELKKHTIENFLFFKIYFKNLFQRERETER